MTGRTENGPRSLNIERLLGQTEAARIFSAVSLAVPNQIINIDQSAISGNKQYTDFF